MEHMGYSFSAIITCAALKTPMIVVYSGIILLIHRGCVAIGNQDILRSPVSIQYLEVCSLWLYICFRNLTMFTYLIWFLITRKEAQYTVKCASFTRFCLPVVSCLANLMNGGYIYHKPKFTHSPAPT